MATSNKAKRCIDVCNQPDKRYTGYMHTVQQSEILCTGGRGRRGDRVWGEERKRERERERVGERQTVGERERERVRKREWGTEKE